MADLNDQEREAHAAWVVWVRSADAGSRTGAAFKAGYRAALAARDTDVVKVARCPSCGYEVRANNTKAAEDGLSWHQCHTRDTERPGSSWERHGDYDD